MGNKLCKKKVDVADNAAAKSPTTLDRIINRLHIRPSAWKSDSQLNQKHVNRCDISAPHPVSKQNNVTKTKPLSRSSDWTDVDLEVPDKEEHVHLRNPKLSIIFNNENGTPTPPPRKHKKNFREKIEAVAKSGLQALQPKKPVEETVCVKKTINYKCPMCDQDENSHNRDHHHNHNHNNAKTNKTDNQKARRNSKEEKDSLKRMNKNLSVMSLPNYDELKLTVTHFDDIDKGPSSLKIDSTKRNTSEISLPIDSKKPITGSTGKLDAYITRCRSFGSLFPQQLKKLRTRKAPAEIESDDSFGGLEDWDLGLLEHYNPKDASLPRPRKTQRNSKEIISDIESLIVAEEDIEKPRPPIRRSESLVKKINRENAQTAHKRSSEMLFSSKNERSNNPTPPPSPNPKPQPRLVISTLSTEDDGRVEHSSLMRILEQFSIKDKQRSEEAPRADEIMVKSSLSSNESSLTPSLLEFEKNIPVNSVEDFIHAEKLNTDRDLVKNNFQALVT